MDLKKELLDFVEANNWFSLEDRKNAEGVVDVYLKTYKKQLTIHSVSKYVVCDYCNGTGWDSYPNHDTTPRPCPECQP